MFVLGFRLGINEIYVIVGCLLDLLLFYHILLCFISYIATMLKKLNSMPRVYTICPFTYIIGEY